MNQTEHIAAYNAVGFLHKIGKLRKRLQELFPEAEINDVTLKQIKERTLGKKLFENCQYHVNKFQCGAENLQETERICAAISRYNNSINIESTKHIHFGRTRFFVREKSTP